MKDLFFLPLFVLLLISSSAYSQSHEQGDIYISGGVSLGAYATQWEAELIVLGVPFKISDSDGAASLTYPINIQYGLADRFSLGAYAEPGQYLDSTDTETNSIIAFGVSPRFYIVNGGKVNWFANVDLGGTTLKWKTSENIILVEKDFTAFHWRLGTGMNWFFTNSVGIFVSGSFGMHNFNLTNWKSDGQDVKPANYTEKLKVTGGQFNFGLALSL